jgi:hypothetical protein
LQGAHKATPFSKYPVLHGQVEPDKVLKLVELQVKQLVADVTQVAQV